MSFQLEQQLKKLEQRLIELEGVAKARKRKSIRLRQMLDNPEDMYPLQKVEVARRCKLVLKWYALSLAGQGKWAKNRAAKKIPERRGWMPLKMFYDRMDEKAAFTYANGDLPNKAEFHHLVKQILKEEHPEWKLKNPASSFALFDKCEDFIYIPTELHPKQKRRKPL